MLGELVCDLGGVDPVQDDLSLPSTVVVGSAYIEALVLSPNIEREGSQQRPI